jgi:hypothetical protein
MKQINVSRNSVVALMTSNMIDRRDHERQNALFTHLADTSPATKSSAQLSMPPRLHERN